MILLQYRDQKEQEQEQGARAVAEGKRHEKREKRGVE